MQKKGQINARVDNAKVTSFVYSANNDLSFIILFIFNKYCSFLANAIRHSDS